VKPTDAGQSRGALFPRNKYLLAIALATFAVCFLEATAIIEIPFGSWFSFLGGSIVSSSSLSNYMQTYGYPSLFALMALESASLPIPSEVVLPFAGYLVSLGLMNYWLAVAVSTLASITGALTDYYIARWLGRPFVVDLLRLFRLPTSALDRAEGWFKRSGQWTVFAARFVPGLRTIISVPAGLFEMKVRPFILMTLAGCFAWSVVLVYAGLLAGKATAAFNSATAIDGIAAIVAVSAAGYVAYYVLPLVRRARPISPALGP
jgi:membrane protein DedA with SNARE-associated domain